MLAGLDLLELPPDRATNVLYALAVDDTNGWVNKSEVRQALNQALLPVATSEQAAASTLAAWGSSREAQDGQEAMMRMLGG